MDNGKSRDIEGSLDNLRVQIDIMENLLDESEGSPSAPKEKVEPAVRAISTLIHDIPADLEGCTNRVRRICERFTSNCLVSEVTTETAITPPRPNE